MYSPRHCELRFVQGSSDKEYRLWLIRDEEDNDNSDWLVNFAYGRYGKPLKYGTKTATPVSYEKAEKAYEKLLHGKQAKGYVCTDNEAGAPSARLELLHGDKTAWLPQLLNTFNGVTLVEVWNRFRPNCWVQTKWDGERRGIIFKPGSIIPANRRGLKTTIAPEIMADLEKLFEGKPWEGVLDCEDMGDHLRIFDYIPVDDVILTTFGERLQNLLPIENRCIDLNLSTLRVDRPVRMNSYTQLKDFVDYSRRCNEEGVVIRDGEGIYTPGRPNSGGPALKYKFIESATCIVESNHPTKRSIAIGLYPQGCHLIGNCTVPPNYMIPPVGTLVEIEYLYAYRGGSLYQPVYKGIRNDISPEACSEAQLKYKD